MKKIQSISIDKIDKKAVPLTSIAPLNQLAHAIIFKAEKYEEGSETKINQIQSRFQGEN